MITSQQELTRDLIFYSVCVSDFEKLDFKNDALAGVRANYFNSGCKEQKEITEIAEEYGLQKLDGETWTSHLVNVDYDELES